MGEQELKMGATFIILLLFLALLIGIFLLRVYFSSLSKLLNYIKNKYPEKWQELGEPTIFVGASPRNIINILRFIFLNGNGSNDPQLNVLVSKAKYSLYVFIIYFLFLIILIICLPSLFVIFKLHLSLLIWSS